MVQLYINDWYRHSFPFDVISFFKQANIKGTNACLIIPATQCRSVNILDEGECNFHTIIVKISRVLSKANNPFKLSFGFKDKANEHFPDLFSFLFSFSSSVLHYMEADGDVLIQQ